jgi:hypothetical protein
VRPISLARTQYQWLAVEIIDGEFELIVLKIDFRRAKDMLQAAGVRIVVRAW